MRTKVLVVMAAVTAFLAVPVTTLGYSPSSAATYADANYNKHPPGGASGCGSDMGECYKNFNNNCANFVSAVLHEAGYDFHGKGTGAAVLADPAKWFSRWSTLYGFVVTTQSWGTADRLYDFLNIDTPGGTVVAVKSGSSTASDSGAGTGDVIFYVWDGISEQYPMDHTSIIVGSGTDPNSGLSGDYVDQQTNDRRHAFWSLKPYNASWDTTSIYVMDIDSGN